MSKELAKTYDPKGLEDRLYQKWLDSGYFHAKVNKAKKPFTIVMPPPNVTGQLHMGHALDETMQDILIRFKRMQGYEALWQPGTDHAAIATEVKVINKLKEQGIDKNEIGREEFLKHAWAWKEEYGGKIINQLKKLGASADWERERFTMDEGCSKAVQEVFIRLYNKGYIYKGSRIINWCPHCKTALSDAEVEYSEDASFFWHLQYPFKDGSGSITVANDLLNERILTGDSTNTVFVNRYESTPKSVKMTQGGAEAGPDTYVYIGGIGGSGFSATFSNFSGSKDGQPTYNNCYTYMTFPAMEGTITGISLIGSIADRAGVSGGTARLTINNCYYLDSSAAIYFGSLPTFYGKSTQSNGQYTYYSLSTLLSTDAARMYMLRGDLSYLSKYTWNTGSSPYNINGLRALSYEQMSGRADIDGKRFTALLNGGSDDGSFHWVTTEENGQSAHGKYSFPGSAAALRGQDYPFPTVLTQGTACLHYGEWPSRGLYWSSGVLSLDRITTPSVTLSLHFTQDTDADAVPVITCSREGIVDVSVPQAQTPPADVRHSYTVTLTGLSVGSTEVFATLGDYTARLLVSVTSTLDISVDGLPGDDFFVGDPCNLTLTARDSRGSALDVEWTVTPQHGNSVLTASAPAVDAGGTASVTLTAAGEGEDRTLITAAYTAPGGETFTSQLPLIIPVRMQGVLGIANTSGEPSVYWQGVMDRDGTAFTDDVPSGAPYTDRPAYAGAKLYLYSRGSAATFDGLSVSGVTVKGGADATEYVLRPMPVSNDEDTSVLHPDVFRAENDDFRVTVGTPAKDTTSAFTYRPLTVKGRSQGQITLTVTLTDAENHAFTLSIPYTLTEEDTRVTATLRVDEQAFTLSVPYGTAPAAEALSQMLTDNGISPDTIDSWTPDITQPLYADTAFTAVPKTTDSGGAPTVPDADTPASGSKDPEGTPSDDPSAPDSSSSGTDPTPEPSPDTLP